MSPSPSKHLPAALSARQPTCVPSALRCPANKGIDFQFPCGGHVTQTCPHAPPNSRPTAVGGCISPAGPQRCGTSPHGLARCAPASQICRYDQGSVCECVDTLHGLWSVCTCDAQSQDTWTKGHTCASTRGPDLPSARRSISFSSAKPARATTWSCSICHHCQRRQVCGSIGSTL